MIHFQQALCPQNGMVSIITHMRAAVAIAMAVVAAISNHTAVTQATAPKRRRKIVDSILDKIALVVEDTTENEPPIVAVTEQTEETRLLRQPTIEHAKQVLKDTPTCTDRERARLIGVSQSTA